MCRARKPKQHALPGMLSCGGVQTQAPALPPGVIDLKHIVSSHRFHILYGTMEIDENTWQTSGDGDHMVQDLKKKRIFTYTSFNREIDPVNIRVLEELQRDPRLTMSALGRRVGMSSPAVTER